MDISLSHSLCSDAADSLHDYQTQILGQVSFTCLSVSVFFQTAIKGAIVDFILLFYYFLFFSYFLLVQIMENM